MSTSEAMCNETTYTNNVVDQGSNCLDITNTHHFCFQYCVFITVCYFIAVRCFCIFVFIVVRFHCCTFSLLYIFIAVHFHCCTFSLLYVFITVRFHCCTFSLLYVFIAVRFHCCTFSLLYAVFIYCLFI